MRLDIDFTILKPWQCFSRDRETKCWQRRRSWRRWCQGWRRGARQRKTKRIHKNSRGGSKLQKLRKWENSFAFCNLILPGPAALDGTRKVSPPVWLDWDSVHSVGTMAEVVCDPTWHWIRKEDCNIKTNQSTWSSWRSGVLQQPRHHLRHRHLLHPHDGLVGLALHLRVHLAGKRFEQMKSQGSKRK